MNDLENGYVHVDSTGNAHFVSYESLGSGFFIVLLLVAFTTIIKDVNSFLISNKWVVILIALFSVFVRTIIFDKDVRFNRRIVFIIGDAVKTICIYFILLAIIDKSANSHWLDRAFFAFLYGALFFVANWLIEWALRFLRINNLSILHLIVCVAISVGALYIYFNHTWYWQGYDYKVLFKSASIVKIDEKMEGTIKIPDKIYGYTVEVIEENAFSNNEKVTYIELPSTVKVIKENAFEFADNLQGVKIPKSVKRIEESSFGYHFEIYYEGSQEEWDKINIQDESIKAMTIHFDSN